MAGGVKGGVKAPVRRNAIVNKDSSKDTKIDNKTLFSAKNSEAAQTPKDLKETSESKPTEHSSKKPTVVQTRVKEIETKSVLPKPVKPIRISLARLPSRFDMGAGAIDAYNKVILEDLEKSLTSDTQVRVEDAPGKYDSEAYSRVISDARQELEDVVGSLNLKETLVRLPEKLAGVGGMKWAFRKDALSKEERINVIKALAKADFDWGVLVATYSIGSEAEKQLLADVRTYQMELAEKLRPIVGMNEKQLMACGSVGLTSDNDYTSLAPWNQAEQVALMSGAFREIFRKESGIVFDTNFYTAHIAMEKGFDISSKVIDAHGRTVKDKSIDDNDIQSKVKQAEYYLQLEEVHADIDVVEFKNTRFYHALASPSAEIIKEEILKKTSRVEKAESAYNKKMKQFETAFYIAKNVHTKVIQRALEIRIEAENRLAQLEIIGSDNIFEYKQVKSKLGNNPEVISKAVEMEAKNKIYVELLVKVEEGKVQYDEKLTDFHGETQKIFKNLRHNNRAQFQARKWVNNGCSLKDCPPIIPVKTAEYLSELNNQIQEIGVRTMGLQSEALHFASEPYYAQATIVGVVPGIQMSGGEAAKILTNVETGLSQEIQDKLAVYDLGKEDIQKMAKDFLLIGKMSKGIQEKFVALDLETQKIVLNKIKLVNVGVLQKLEKEYPLFALPETFMIAMQENHGDFVKDYSHYVVHAETASEDKFILKGSKYLFRTAWCADRYFTKQSDKMDSPLHNAFKILRDESKVILDVRQKSTGIAEEDFKIVRDSAMNFLIEIKKLEKDLPKLAEKIKMNTDGEINKEHMGESLMDVVEAMMARA